MAEFMLGVSKKCFERGDLNGDRGAFGLRKCGRGNKQKFVRELNAATMHQHAGFRSFFWFSDDPDSSDPATASFALE